MAVDKQDRNLSQAGIPYGAVMTALAAEAPDQVALVCDGPDTSMRVSRSELEAWSNRLARAYAELGLSCGDFATIALPNGAEFFAACLAIWKLGAVPNPISHRLLIRGVVVCLRVFPLPAIRLRFYRNKYQPMSGPWRQVAVLVCPSLLWLLILQSMTRSVHRHCLKDVVRFWFPAPFTTVRPSARHLVVCFVVVRLL
jgi:non-ribosomal peptide synthetase component F